MLLTCRHHILLLNEIIVLLYLTTGYFAFTDSLKLIFDITQISGEPCSVRRSSILSVSWLLPPATRFIRDLCNLFCLIYCQFRCKIFLIIGMQWHFWFADTHSVPLGFLLSYSFWLRCDHLRCSSLWSDFLIINLLFLLRFFAWGRWWLLIIWVILKVSAVPVLDFISDTVWCQACLIELRLAMGNFLLISLSLYLKGIYVRFYVRRATFLTRFACRCHRYVMVWLSM